MKNAAAWALAALQALGLWVLSDIKTDTRELRGNAAIESQKVAGLVAWAKEHGYAGPN